MPKAKLGFSKPNERSVRRGTRTGEAGLALAHEGIRTQEGLRPAESLSNKTMSHSHVVIVQLTFGVENKT